MYTIYEEHIEILEKENEKLEQQLILYKQLIDYKTYGPPIHSREELNNKKQFCAMDWIPHIVVKASTDSCAATTTTALRTFETGFPGHKAIVHYVGTNAEREAFCKKWCSDGGHKFVRYYQSIRH